MFSNTVVSLFLFLEAISRVEPVTESVNHGAIETYHRLSLASHLYIYGQLPPLSLFRRPPVARG